MRSQTGSTGSRPTCASATTLRNACSSAWASSARGSSAAFCGTAASASTRRSSRASRATREEARRLPHVRAGDARARRGGGRGWSGSRRARLPVLRSPCRRARDSPRGGARARARHANWCVPRLPRAHAEARPRGPARLMTYAALLEAYGWERFDTDVRAAGATSLIVADLPAGERPELRRVPLVAPTSTDERLRVAADQTDGWLYLVAVTGTTGARTEVSPALAGLVERARAVTARPLYAGFGI